MTTQKRSEIMRAVKATNTAPEFIVRRILYALGYRYRLHSKKLRGKPDLVFKSRRKIIFINGCFWHGHLCKRGSRVPKTNTDYWRNKISGNISRDKQNYKLLRGDGWRILVVWECELKDLKKLQGKLVRFLERGAP